MQEDTPLKGRLARPSDPPLAFREDRRGKSPRTDRDYAELAASYLAAAKPRQLAREWSERFGRTAQRWRMDLAAAARFIEGPKGAQRLTHEGELLVYGGPLDPAEVEEIKLTEWLDLMLLGADHLSRRVELARIDAWGRQRGLKDPWRTLERLVDQQRRNLAQAEAYLYREVVPVIPQKLPTNVGNNSDVQG